MWYICRLKSFLADDKQTFTHFALFFSFIIDIFLLLCYFHFSLLYILSSVEIFETKWYGFQNTMLCIGLLYNSSSHLRPIRLLFLSLDFIICYLYPSYLLTVCCHGLFCTAAVNVIKHFGFLLSVSFHHLYFLQVPSMMWLG